ncbi:hypothetical protein ACU610_06165 [Geodermatophilus sp. URMC 61]|uniref:hypothetical protein n=1 Tax=Geodermatophilus sp. URMC 61 TaxID=3423411 RepID=UPI00406BF5BC
MPDRYAPVGPPGPGSREPVSWPVVLGLGALALLFPLAELSGVTGILGAAPTALLLVGLVAVVWIGGIGLGRVPRPVLTATLAGVVFGVVLVALSRALGTGPDVDGASAVGVAAFEIGRSAALGALAGLLAAAVQRNRGPRR